MMTTDLGELDPNHPAVAGASGEVRAVVRTLLVTDLVDSTRLVETLGDHRSLAVFRRHDRMARELLIDHDGIEIDKADGFLLLFRRPIDAVAYALEYHEALATLSEELEVELAARIGIHLGEVFLIRNAPEMVARGAKPIEVGGVAKPIAARLMSLATGRQTLLTHSAFDLARRAAVDGELAGRDLDWMSHGSYVFKGVDEALEVFEMGPSETAPLTPPPDSAKARRSEPSGPISSILSGIAGESRTSAARGSWTEKEHRPAVRRRLRYRASLVALAVALAVALLPGARRAVVDWLAPAEPPRAGSPQPATGQATAPPVRVLVMPFESLGPPERAYFAAGLTEEVTRRLASLRGVGVISRTTARRYARSDLDLRQIGEELDVAYVLEGTVNWPPEDDGAAQIRITPRLIRVADDTHVWTTAYQRLPEHVLRVQSEIAASVAEQLNLTLLGSEKRSLEAAMTQVPAAYFAYLRGLDYTTRSSYVADNLLRAERMFERAVEKDPTFVEAWAELSGVHSFVYFNSDVRDERRRLALEALETARALDPQRPAVRIAAAYYSYRVDEAYERALETFTALRREMPHNAEILSGIGYIERRLGEPARAAEILMEAFTFDRDTGIASDIAVSYRAMRNYAEADSWYKVGRDLQPDDPSIVTWQALNVLAWKGCSSPWSPAAECSTEPAWEVFAQAPSDEANTLFEWLLLRSFELTTLPPQARPAHDAATLDHLQATVGEVEDPVVKCLIFWREALLYDRLGRHQEAHALVEKFSLELQERVAEAPDYSFYIAGLGIAYGYLGQHEMALAAGRRAVELGSEDRFTGPRYRESLAVIYTLLGEEDQAIDILGELLDTSYQDALTPVDLHLDPVWEPLRKSPRFAELLRSHRPPPAPGAAEPR